MRYRYIVSLLALAAAVTFLAPISDITPLSAGKVLADKGSGSGGNSGSSNSGHDSENSGPGSENSGRGNAHSDDNDADDHDDQADDHDDDCIAATCPGDDGTPDQGPGDAPGTETPGDDDGTPDQGPGDN